MLTRLDRLAYHCQHLSFLINATVMEEAARLVTRNAAACDGARGVARAAAPPHRAAPPRSRERRGRRCTRASCCSTSRCAATCASSRACCAMRRASCAGCATNDFKDIPEVDKRAVPAVLPAHVPLADRRLLQRALGRGLRARRRAVVPRHRRRDAPADHPADHASSCARRRRRARAAARRRLRHRAHAAPARAHAPDDAAARRRYVAGVHPARAQAARRRRGADARGRERRGAAVGRRDVRHRDERLHVPRAAAQRAAQRRARDAARRAAGRPRRDRGLGAARPRAPSSPACCTAFRASSTSRSTRTIWGTISAALSTRSASSTWPSRAARRQGRRRKTPLTERVRTCAPATSDPRTARAYDDRL